MDEACNMVTPEPDQLQYCNPDTMFIAQLEWVVLQTLTEKFSQAPWNSRTNAICKRANLSSFWRALLIYPFLAFVLTGPIVYIRDEIPHSRTIVIAANVLIFLGTWFLIHKWIIKAAKKKESFQKGSIHYKKGK
jgi:hypothetical protein